MDTHDVDPGASDAFAREEGVSPIGKSGIHMAPADGGDEARVDVGRDVGTEALVEWVADQPDLPSHLEFDLEAGSEISTEAVVEATESRGIDAEFR